MQSEEAIPDQWEDEFDENDFQSTPLLVGCYHACAVFFALATYEFLSAEDTESSWNRIRAGPHIYCTIFCASLVGIIRFNSARSLIVRKYNTICSVFTILVYFNTIWFYFIREVQQVYFKHDNATRVVWAINFSGKIPVRSCHDADPVHTWKEWPYIGAAVGCNNLILSGNIMSFYALIAMLPAVFRMRWRYALLVTVVNAFMLAAAVLGVGSRTWMLLTAILFQAVAGFSAVLICKNRERLARDRFAMAKETDNAARQNRILLHTLIPEDVLGRLASHAGDDMLGTHIPECTVMFCALDPQAELQAALSEEFFDFLSVVFRRFDDAVEQYGMFKYQHVVRCPRPPLRPRTLPGCGELRADGGWRAPMLLFCAVASLGFFIDRVALHCIGSRCMVL
jgi:hypothetical protein